jgi:hypothetical protein
MSTAAATGAGALETAGGPAAGIRWDPSDLYAGPDDPAIDRDLDAARRYHPHVLSEPEERVIEELSNTGSRAFGRLFDDLPRPVR